MSRENLKGVKKYRAIAGHSDAFPKIFGWNGVVTGSMCVGWWSFVPSCDSKDRYLLMENEVYIPEIDGDLFPIEKGYAKRKD